jgi:hypothetical protein
LQQKWAEHSTAFRPHMMLFSTMIPKFYTTQRLMVAMEFNNGKKWGYDGWGGWDGMDDNGVAYERNVECIDRGL